MPSQPHDQASAVAGFDESTLWDRLSDNESYDGRPSGELSDADNDILASEDEREQLLTQKEGLSGFLKAKGVDVGKRLKREMRELKRGQRDESSELMYEMGQDVGASNFDLRSRRSSESDGQRLLAMKMQRKVCSVDVYVYVYMYIHMIKGLLTVVDTASSSVATTLHIHVHRRLLCVSSDRCISPLYAGRQKGHGDHGIQWDFPFRAYNHLDISRWFPRRLSASQPHAHTQPVHTTRHLARVHAA